MHRLIECVKGSNTPDNCWDAQMFLLKETERLEGLIQKRRCQRAGLKQAKLAYSRRAAKRIAQIKKYDRLIEFARDSEERHDWNRRALRYLGDTLAFRFLEAHEIKILCRNEGPGFISGKEGLDLEVECGRELAEAGAFAVLTDLTHCLTIGDIVVIDPNGRKMIIECKRGGQQSAGQPALHRDGRLERQFERNEYAADLLANEEKTTVQGSPKEHPYLGRVYEPLLVEEVKKALGYEIDQAKVHIHKVVAVETSESYLVDAFTEVCDLGDRPFRIISPEPGLVYIAIRPSTPPDDWVPLLFRLIASEEREILLGGLADRMVWGMCPYVPPITLHDIPVRLLAEVLAGRVLFYTIMDLAWLKTQIERQNIGLKVRVDNSGILFEITKKTDLAADFSLVGPRMIHNVGYGLLSLETAMRNIIELAKAYVGILSEELLRQADDMGNAS